jgi:hypothetical protein
LGSESNPLSLPFHDPVALITDESSGTGPPSIVLIGKDNPPDRNADLAREKGEKGRNGAAKAKHRHTHALSLSHRDTFTHASMHTHTDRERGRERERERERERGRQVCVCMCVCGDFKSSQPPGTKDSSSCHA